MKEVVFLKIMIESSIKSRAENILTHTHGILNNGKVIYKDNDNISVTLYLNQDNILLVRENSQYKLKLDFSNNKCTYKLKENNASLDMSLNVINIFIENNSVEIKYKLEDDDFMYKLNYEVIK